jgi:DNA-binding response OmpR family regulator
MVASADRRVVARDHGSAEVAALDAGADDFVTKPFSAPECWLACAQRCDAECAVASRRRCLRLGRSRSTCTREVHSPDGDCT